MATKRDAVLGLARNRGVIRPRDLRSIGVAPSYLHDLTHDGALRQVGRGLFVLPHHCFTEHHSLAEVAAHAPRAIVCLLSALQFHGIGTQMPHAIWIAIPSKAHVPTVDTVPLEVVRMASASLRAGAEVHCLEGVPVHIFSAAKTIADCFKFRLTVGLDVALEALRDGLARDRVTPADLYEYAVINRVWGVMRPYIEALG